MVRRWKPLGCVVGLVLLADLSGLAGNQLKPLPVAEWIESLERPERVEGLRIDFVVARLGLQPGQNVVDVGAGPGVFSLPLAAAVSPGGKVYAVELDQGFLDHIKMRAREREVSNVETVLGKPTDPNLPTRGIDLAFIHDVLHHVADRPGYLKALARYVKPTGRVAIIELGPTGGPHENEPDLVVTKPQVDAWMAAAGFALIEQIEGLPNGKWFSVYARVPDDIGYPCGEGPTTSLSGPAAADARR